LVKIACPEMIRFQERKKKEDYFEKRTRELNSDLNQMDFLTKGFLTRVGFNDETCNSLEKLGVRERERE